MWKFSFQLLNFSWAEWFASDFFSVFSTRKQYWSAGSRAARALFTSLPRFEVAHSFAVEVSGKTFLSLCKSGSIHTVCFRHFSRSRRNMVNIVSSFVHMFVIVQLCRGNVWLSVSLFSEWRYVSSDAEYKGGRNALDSTNMIKWYFSVFFFDFRFNLQSTRTSNCLVSCLNADEFLCAVFVTTGGNPSAFAGCRSRKESRFENFRFLGNFVVFNQRMKRLRRSNW